MGQVGEFRVTVVGGGILVVCFVVLCVSYPLFFRAFSVFGWVYVLNRSLPAVVAIFVYCSHFWVVVLGVIGGGLTWEVNFM